MLNDRIIWTRFEEKQAQDSFSWRLFNLSSLGGVWVAPDPECGHKPNLQTHPRSLLLSNAHFWEFAGFGGFANGGGSWCDAGGGPLASEFNHSLCSNPNVPRNELRIAAAQSTTRALGKQCGPLPFSGVLQILIKLGPITGCKNWKVWSFTIFTYCGIFVFQMVYFQCPTVQDTTVYVFKADRWAPGPTFRHIATFVKNSHLILKHVSQIKLLKPKACWSWRIPSSDSISKRTLFKFW